jgi:biopolymer transport protein ExbD
MSTLKVNTFQRHLVKSKSRRARARRMLVAALMLTSMVDMFSLLVIFLLQSFSTSPMQVPLASEIHLPAAMSGSEVTDGPVLAINGEAVFLDEKSIGNPILVLKKPALLTAELEKIKSAWMKAHPTETFSGELNLQADSSLSSVLVSRFIDIAVSQGFSSVRLAVADAGS